LQSRRSLHRGSGVGNKKPPPETPATASRETGSTATPSAPVSRTSRTSVRRWFRVGRMRTRTRRSSTSWADADYVTLTLRF